MKTKITTLIMLLLTSLTSIAQQGINYKALIRDNAGNAVANQLIAIEFDILESGTTSVYKEQHTPTTDANGIIVLNIGQGTILSGVFNTIDWGANTHFLNVQVNTGAGLTDMGTTEFMAVPYAKHAATATTALNAGATSINELADGKSDNDGSNNGSSLFLGINAGLNDDQSNNKNVGIGYSALNSNTTGYDNVANGYSALYSNTTGIGNTANGSEALNNNTTGEYNTANGSYALYSNTTGINNTANGSGALYSNTTGDFNAANGSGALNNNTTGINNTANGSSALYSNTIGGYNTANGSEALNNNTTGEYNTANGSGALYSNTTGGFNVANGSGALNNNTTGYNNTANGSSALYSNTTGSDNTANGSYALNSNTTGFYNVANGSSALNNNTTGFYNVANGSSALYSNTTGSDNTANGSYALFSNTTGINNTANGSEALAINTTGEYNTANGYSALYSNTTGVRNTANGSSALYSNTTGINNTANGNLALYSNTTGVRNTANGSSALESNTTGDYNTANGSYALGSNTTGSFNVALGYKAGYYETGSNKLYIANSNTTTPLIYGEFDTKKLVVNGQLTAVANTNTTLDLIVGGTSNSTIGDNGYISSNPNYSSSDLFLRSYDALVIQLDYDNNESGNFQIKNGAGAVVFDVSEAGDVRVNGTLTHSSDRRLKKDIETLPYGLKEILQLQPKAYNWKDREQNHKSLGLIAQEVQPIISEVVSKANDKQQTLGVSYTALIPVLINAIKEQQKVINKLKTQVDTDQATITTQQELMQDLLTRVKNIEDKQENTISDNN
jgi:hypothetical protein